MHPIEVEKYFTVTEQKVKTIFETLVHDPHYLEVSSEFCVTIFLNTYIGTLVTPHPTDTFSDLPQCTCTQDCP